MKRTLILFFQKQCDAYLGWLNSQLKKKSESVVVKDLQSGLSDGTALADLIEIVGKKWIQVLFHRDSKEWFVVAIHFIKFLINKIFILLC